MIKLGWLWGGQATKSFFYHASIVLGRSQCKSWDWETPSPSTHPSSETNLLSPITSWLTRVIRLRPWRRLYPLSGQMQWHKGGPDAPLSSCWPLPLFQSLRKGPEVEKVLGTGHIAALITHSVTIEPNVWPPPLGLTPSWQAGKVMGPLWLVCQQSAKTSPLRPLPQLCSCWLTAAKCFSPVLLCTGVTHREEQETGIMGGVRRWVTGGTLHSIKGFFLRVVLCKQKSLFWSVIYQRLLLLTSSLRRDYDWLRGQKKKKESVHRQDIPPLVNSKVNTSRKRVKEVYLFTQTRVEMLADVLPCIKD